MSSIATEREILDSLSENLRAQGYDVYRQPSASTLPGFMKGYIPDAVAYRDDRNLAIEIVDNQQNRTQKLKTISELFQSDPKWDLRIVYTNSVSVPDPVITESTMTLRSTIEQIDELLADGQVAMANVVGFACLEAIARKLSTTNISRPQRPISVIEALTSQGYLQQDEADDLRRLAAARNTYVHGGLGLVIDPTDVSKLAEILKRLIEEAATEPA
ncbi:hypothetical protein [Aurantimonas marianensis]|uniref:REase AHJR-like domain-containing protein n=1 Tax=Aurantimonas marianensis TaxID=2920428 RepID=A0A9X2KJD0_9HYPH|nr:hypothetical protein [Aurantimonas marianensis]MCP3056532.1 hypothetical protein [Aurantimonas marianensis]